MFSNSQATTFVPRPYDFKELEKDLHFLTNQYPFLTVNRIGRTVLNQPIYEIVFGNGIRKVHWNGSFHANEWITSCVLIKMLEWLCQTVSTENVPFHKEVAAFYQNNTLSIVPMVNPDGVNLVVNGHIKDEKYMSYVMELNKGKDDFTGWKANIRGVDLNNQFPANWKIEKERKKPKSFAPRDYPGDAPLTEPESIAMSNLAIERKFDLILALHTQGKEFYWGYDYKEPDVSEVYAQFFTEVSPFKAVKTIDSHAGYKDWYIQDFRKPGFTLELGKGINPLPLSMFDEIFLETFPILLTSLYNLEVFEYKKG